MQYSANIQWLTDEVIHIDPFFDEETYLEILTLESIFKKPIGEAYGGKRADVPRDICVRILDILKAHGFEGFRIIGSRLRRADHTDIHDYHSLIHTDHDCDKALVIYLDNTLYKDASEAGTHFWKFKKTEKNKINKQSPNECFLYSKVLEKHSTDLQLWEPWLKVPFKNNSAILLDSLLFHSPPSPFNAKNTNGQRLTLDLFLESPPSKET